MKISSIGNYGSVPGLTQPATVQQRALIQAAKSVNAAELFGENSELTFVMDQKLNKMIVRVIDRTSGDVTLQIPAEYLLQLAEEMKGG